MENTKTSEQIAEMVLRKVQIIINNEVPHETCVQKEERAKWKREQIKKKVAAVLYPGGMGITISI